jgi:hypothetical protein
VTPSPSTISINTPGGVTDDIVQYLFAIPNGTDSAGHPKIAFLNGTGIFVARRGIDNYTWYPELVEGMDYISSSAILMSYNVDPATDAETILFLEGYDYSRLFMYYKSGPLDVYWFLWIQTKVPAPILRWKPWQN